MRHTRSQTRTRTTENTQTQIRKFKSALWPSTARIVMLPRPRGVTVKMRSTTTVLPKRKGSLGLIASRTATANGRQQCLSTPAPFASAVRT